MAGTLRLPDTRRAASEAAILGAAWREFARAGPDGVSLRDVARGAGRTHTLVGRYFGSKDGLVVAAGERLTAGVSTAVDAAWASTDPLADLLAVARKNRSWVQLLVRCGLGDLRPAGFAGCLGTDRLLSRTLASDHPGGGPPGRRSRLLTYGAASLLLGWLTFDDFLVTAIGLRQVSRRHLDPTVAATADRIMGLAGSTEPPLIARDLGAANIVARPQSQQRRSSSDRLLASAVILFAERGPASVTVRDIGQHAGVNQGLIYRHFGSKEALLAEAIQEGTSALLPAALASDGFDFDLMSQLLHHGSPAPRLIARTIVDGIDITTVRQQFPVLRRLLDAYGRVTTGKSRVDADDPRIAVASVGALALGSAIWGDLLRPTLGLSDRDGVDAAIADLAQHLLPTAQGPDPAATSG